MTPSTLTLSQTTASKNSAGGRPNWLPLAVIVAVSVFAFFLRLGNFGVIDGSESYYPAAVREMVEAHSYLVPQMNYQVYFSKPIMTFWLIASAYHMFGVNAFAGRFFGALLGVLLTLSIFAVTRALRGNKAGLLAGLLYCGSPFVLEYFRVSSVDAYFTSFLGFAFTSFLAVVSARKYRLWLPIYLALGLAVLTKGPAALVLFGGGAVLSGIALRLNWAQLKFWLSKLHLVKGLFALLAVAAPWYIAVGLATKWLFLKVFFVYENLGRFNGHTNMRAWYWWRYIAVVFAGLIPWSLLLPAAFTDTFKARLAAFKGQVTTGDAPSISVEESLDAKTVCVFWALAVILAFSISKTQMEPYILPAVAPLTIAVALYVVDWSEKLTGIGRWTLEKCSIAAMYFGPLLAGAVIVAAFVMKDTSLPFWVRLCLPVSSLIMALTWVWQRKPAREGRYVEGCIAIALSSALFVSTFVAGGMEYWYNKKFADLHYLCGVIRTQTVGEVGLYGNYRPSVFYYVRRPVNCFYQAHWLQKRPGIGNFVWVLCRNSEVPRVESESGVALAPYLVRSEWGIYKADNAYLQPYATLWQTFSTLSVPDIITDRYHLGVLTDCLSGGPLWKGK